MDKLSFGRLARASTTHVAFAFLAMGAWAAFANRYYPPGRVAAAALVQGLMSGLITLVLKRFLEAFSRRLSKPLAYVAPPAISCLAVLALLLGVHRLAGTPEVWRTIAVPSPCLQPTPGSTRPRLSVAGPGAEIPHDRSG